MKDQVRAIILAGGEGKRLRPLSFYLQKCMIPIGNKQRPLLEYIVRLLRRHGITDITMLVGYKNEQITGYFEDGTRFGVNITYVQDEPTMKGTGGALLNLYQKGLLDTEGSLLIYYGDILSNINLSEMMAHHERTGATATLALAQGYEVPVGVAQVKGEQVIGWTEKPALNIPVGIGILALDTKILCELPSLAEGKKEFDITKDLVPYLVEKGDQVRAYFTKGFWYDVGSVEKYEKLDNSTIDECFAFLLNPLHLDLRKIHRHGLRRFENRRRIRSIRNGLETKRILEAVQEVRGS